MRAAYPILEFDPDSAATIRPELVTARRDVTPHCVLCFFREVVEEVAAQPGARLVDEFRWEDGPHRVYEIEHLGRRVAFLQPGVGAAMSAGLLEETIALGCQRFVVCGGAGVLNKETAVGHLIVVSAALRDEGVSYHYLPPARMVEADPHAVAALEAVVRERGLPCVVGATWTTDAPYRETRSLVALRREEGCLTVEMEAAALLAVARFRGVTLGQVLYGGDDVSGAEWDDRRWQSRAEIRRNLFWLAAEACLRL